MEERTEGPRSRLPSPARIASTLGRGWRRKVAWGAAILYGATFLYGIRKPLPEGISMAGPFRDARGMELVLDLTHQNNGQAVSQQEIFRRVFAMIDRAESFVVLDMFLFNGEHGEEKEYLPLAGELTRRLVARTEARPGLQVVFITDEINNFYGAYTSPEVAALEAAGVRVVLTRMKPLRDSNPIFSAAWRIVAGWMGTGGPGWLPHPLSSTGRKVTARAYLKLLNFKANHRKVVVTEKECLVASANPHDASSFHSNIAFAGSNPVCGDLLVAERAVAALSGEAVEEWPAYQGQPSVPATPPYGPGAVDVAPSASNAAVSESAFPDPSAPDGGDPVTSGSPRTPDPDFGRVRVVSEGMILRTLLGEVDAAGPGDRVELAMFYLAHRKVVGALLSAHRRGARVRLILDPNKDAFGREKRGIPNRQAARELVLRSGGGIAVRWFDTHGEQFHTKLALITRGDAVSVLGGSANLTRRNLGDYNLELDLHFLGTRGTPVAAAADAFFQKVFSNDGGDYTLPFAAYRDDSWIKRVAYRVQEFTGLSSF